MASAAAYSSLPPLPPWILLDTRACDGDYTNGTTSEALTTSGKHTIKASLRLAEAPTPSRLFVRCHPNQEDPDEVLFQDPCIVCTADAFLLLRVCIGARKGGIMKEKNDYFIYQPQAPRPSLRLLPKLRSDRYIHDDGIGLLPRGEHFTIAALLRSMNGGGFDLHLFSSESWAWTVFNNAPLVEPPQRPFPVDIPGDAALIHHYSVAGAVITLGEAAGTMGWVDLWHGILFCDVLSSSPTLRDVPLPLPMAVINHGKAVHGCPNSRRSISVVQGCLIRLVEMDIHCERLPTIDPETGSFVVRFDDWEIFTYTNSKITGSLEDWHLEHAIKASDIDLDRAMRWQLLQSGLLQNKTPQGPERKLQNLYASQPVLSPDGEGIVYLLTKVKFMQRRAWVLAIDIKGNKVQALADFGVDRTMGLSYAFRPSRISSYVMNASATPAPGGLYRPQQADDWESSAE